MLRITLPGMWLSSSPGAALQFAPLLKSHDPSPPLNLEQPDVYGVAKASENVGASIAGIILRPGATLTKNITFQSVSGDIFRSGSGVVSWAASLAGVEASDTAVGFGSVPVITGPLAAVEGADLAAAAGGIFASGTLISSEDWEALAATE